MANLEQPEGEGQLPVENDIPAGMSAKGVARRRFARAGAGASAGAILTLASQPAMATLVCASPSGALSGNLSRHNEATACNGLSPGFWKNNHSLWSGAYTNGTSKFQLTFPTTSRCSQLNAYTCFDIVDPNQVTNGHDPDNVAMHIMATLLNVRSNRIGFLTENQVMAIWNSYSATGTYKPTSTVTWGGAQIVAYLTSTMS
ncbi:MAG: hypothetical protein JWP34_39 [Massilia sp.]|nr:hypothetical protein [Massilia sp.]